ncbi:MAG: CoA transferase subunit A [Gemmatimonadota bacterium]|nr:CoA transferase subunit A [Gemmatimonadota bacterium]MDE2829997.1 CoA transferase subunit A [Gemmatimonadota bacterium]
MTSSENTGRGPLFTDPDPDVARAFFREKKGALTDKLMSVSDAIARFVHDGDYLASGGFGGNRIATALLHEVVRQERTNLGFAGHTTTHDFQILAAGTRTGKQIFSRLDAAYILGLEARGLSAQARRLMESGEVEVCEWTNYALACRFRAAATGVPFMPVRSMLGTDTFRESAAKEIECPFTGKSLTAVPALYPDVALIHVHESDLFGNCRIRGITVADWDLSRASKRVIVSAERIVSTDEIRSDSNATAIPAFCVDAVCHVPYGSYPGNMAGEYFSDEVHLKAWLDAEQDVETYRAFLDKYLYGVDCFESYLEICGGEERLAELRRLEGKGAGYV